MAVGDLGAVSEAFVTTGDRLRDCGNLCEGCDNVGQPHVLMDWLEQEVVARLAMLDTKIDQLQHKLLAAESQSLQPPIVPTHVSTAGAEQEIRKMNRHSTQASNTQQSSRSGSNPRPYLAPSLWQPMRLASRSNSVDCIRPPSKQRPEDCQPPAPRPTPNAPGTQPPCVELDEEMPPESPTALKNASNYKLTKAALGMSNSANLSDGDSTRGDFVEVDMSRNRRDSDKRSEGSCQVLEDRALSRPEHIVHIWNFLSNPEYNRGAGWYAVIMPAITLMSVTTTLLQTGEPPFLHGLGAAVVEVTFETVFAMELLLRFVTCPSRRGFLSDFHNAADVLAVLPLALRAAVGFVLPDSGSEGWRGAAAEYLLCIVPILRLLKMLRRFERFRLVIAAVEQAFEALPILLFSLFELTLVFSALIFLVEPRDNIESLPRAIWLTIVTMTTVGYGDVTPTNTPGIIVVSLLVIMSVLYMAMPLGIVGQAFVQVWSDRDRILLLHRTQERLKQWGYTARDALQIFYWFDEDGSGNLEIDEFQTMVEMMRLGLNKQRVHLLFNSIDVDGGGTIDAREFVKFLYPEEYHDIFGIVKQEDTEDEESCGKDSPAGLHSQSPRSPTAQECW
uniref:EF-hand domain-containing protein n=1 Tax=Pyrodinium bahamense TaxID=73915 RepID=A0A7S0FG85_9DINO